MSKAMSILKILPRGVSLGQKKQFYAHMVRTEDQKSGRIPSSEKDVDERAKQLRLKMEGLRQKVDQLRQQIIRSDPSSRTQRAVVETAAATGEVKKERVVDILKRLKFSSIATQSLTSAGAAPAARKAVTVAKKVHDTTQCFFKNREEDRQHVQELIRPLLNGDEDEVHKQLAVVVPLLCSYSGREEVIQHLKEEPPNTESLAFALMRGISSVREDKIDTLLDVIRTLSPAGSPPPEPMTDLNVHRMALIFGDSFIKRSGYEGEQSSMPFVHLMQAFLASKGELTEEESSMQKALSGVVDLRVPGDTSEHLAEISAQVERNGRCLISGGWLKHAIMYEIVKQDDGRYEFRIYNEGEGIQYHSGGQIGYKRKTEGCKVVRDIPHELLFRGSVLANLEQLFQMTKSDEGAEEKRIGPDAYLYEHIVPMLDGHHGEITPEMHRELSPQRSGTCTYRCLQAWAAYQMKPEVYTKFKYEFRQFLLDSFLHELQESSSQPIQNEGEYKTRTKEYASMKRSVEKFAQAVEKHEEILSPDEMARTQKTLLQFQTALLREERQLLAYEKTVYRGDLESATTQPMALFGLADALPVPVLPDETPPVAFYDLATESLEANFTTLLDSIQQIPKSSEGGFSQQVEQALHDLAAKASSLPREKRLYAFQELFRKIGGTTSSLDALHFANPQTAFQDFRAIMESMNNDLVESLRRYAGRNPPAAPRAEQYLAFFAAQYGMENAFRQIPESQRGLQADFPSALGAPEIQGEIQHLCCTDPLWVNFKKSVQSLPRGSNPFSDICLCGLRSQQPLGLHSLSSALGNWYRNTLGRPIKDRIARSIRDDRAQQETEIRQRQDQLQRQIDSEKASLARLVDEGRRLQRELPPLRESVRSLQQRYDQELSAYRTRNQEITRWDQQDADYQRYLQTEQYYRQYPGSRPAHTPAAPQRPPGSRPNALPYPSDWELRNAQSQVDAKNREIAANSQNQSYCHDRIAVLGQQFQAVPHQVKHDPRFWPQNVENDQALLIKFLFSVPDFLSRKTGDGDIIPPLLRQMCFSSVHNRQLFYKKDDTNPVPFTTRTISFTWDYESSQCSLTPLNNQRDFSDRLSPDRHDVYRRMLGQGSEETQLYQLLASSQGRIPEGSVPYQEANAPLRLASDDVRAFLQLRSAPETQIVSTLDYFRDHLDKLEKRDEVLLFHALLFEDNLLLKDLQDVEKRKHLIPLLQSFFTDAIQSCQSTERIGAAANLLWIGAMVQKQVDAVYEAEGVTTAPSVVALNQMIPLLTKGLEAKYIAHRPVLFDSIIASAGSLLKKEPSQLTPDEQKIMGYVLLSCILGRDKHSVVFDQSSYQKMDAREEALLELKRFLGRVPPRDPLLLTLVNDHVRPLLDRAFPNLAIGAKLFVQGTDRDVFVIPGELQLCLSTGQIVSSKGDAFQGVEQKPLSQEHIDLLKGYKIFGDGVDLTAVRGVSSRRDGKEYFRFTLPNKETKKSISYMIEVDPAAPGPTLYVQFEPHPGNAQWTKFIPESERASYTDDKRALKEKYLHLQSGLDGTVFLCDPKTYEVHYRTRFDALRGKVGFMNVEKGRSGSLVLAELPEGDTLFSSFEEKEHTACWSDRSGNLQRIEFSRLHVSFTREGEQWVLENQKEWHLAEEQFAPHLRQKTGFLVLENGKGEKKVLLPVWPPKVPTNPDGSPIKEKDYSLNFPYEYAFQKEESSVHYVECDIKEGVLEPKDYEARFYLARIYLEKGYVDEAEELLFSHFAEAPHSKLADRERSLLESIATMPLSGDIGSRTLRLRLRALALLEKNIQQFPETDRERIAHREAPSQGEIERKAKSLKEAHKLIKEYVTRMAHLAPLSPDDERAVYRGLYSQFQKANLSVDVLDKRLHELEAEDPDDLPEAPISFAPPPPLDMVGGLQREFQTAEAQDFLSRVQEVIAQTVTEEGISKNLEYRQARLLDRFPFDYTRVDKETLEEYFPSMVKEANEKSYQTLRQSGLIPVLYHMAFFNDDEDVKKMAQHCLLLIASKGGPRREEFQEQVVAHVRSPDAHPSPLAVARKEAHDLIPLEGVQRNPEESTLLSELVGRERFLIKQTIHQEQAETAEALFSEESVEIGSDPTVRRQFEKMTDDLRRAAELSQKTTQYTVNEETAGRNLSDLKAELQTNLTRETQTLVDMRDMIVGSVSSALQADPVSHAKFVAGKRTLPSIEELCILATRKDFNERMAQNFPEISEDGRRALQDAVREYLIQLSYQQRIGRAIDLIKKIQALPPEEAETKAILINDLGKALETKRAYELDDEHALVFLFMETTLNITLRKDQVDNILRFADAAERGDPIALQMIMGAGKTSVLQPILGYLFSVLTTSGKEGLLSAVMLPEALFGKVKDELFKALGSSFHQYVFVLPYDRELAKHTDYLKTYEKRLREAQQQGACLLMTPKQKHSILTSLYEAYYDLKRNPTDRTFQDRVDTIANICQFLHLHEADQVDEIDLVKNPNVIFKYPIGEKSKINTQRATVLSQILIELATDDEFNSQVALDFCTAYQKRLDPTYQKKGLHLTPALFDSVVRPKLLEKAHRAMKGVIKGYEGRIQDHREYVDSFLDQTTPFDERIQAQVSDIEQMHIALYLRDIEDKQALLDQIRSSPESVTLPEGMDRQQVCLVLEKHEYEAARDHWIEETFSSEEREILGATSHTICNILPDSLMKECGAHYGKDPEAGQYIARPYEAPNAPKTTKYSDPYQTDVFSTQMVLYNGIPLEAAKRILLQLRKSAKDELETVPSLDQTEGGRWFTEVMRSAPHDIPRFDLFEEPLSQESIHAFQKMASRHPPTIQRFLQEFVYGQINIFPESLSSTPQALTGSSHYACGYTGTMHTSILPQTMTGIPELGTDGKTITAIQRKMAAGTSETRVLQEGALPQQVIDTFGKMRELFVYIDSGGVLKEEKIQKFCERLLQEVSNPHPGGEASRPEIKGVVFLNDEDEGRPWIVEKTEDGAIIVQPLSKSQRKTNDGSVLTVMAQKYETGTNLPQKPDAMAMMSIRKNMTLRDALQSVFRMRQILSGQNVCFALAPEVLQHISLGIVNGLLEKEEIQALFGPEIPSDGEVARALQGLPEEIKTTFQDAFKELRKGGREPNEREYLMRFHRLFSEHFEEKCDSGAIWRYLNVNQARAEQEKNWRAAEQRMREVLEKPLRRVLHDVRLNRGDRLALFNHMQEFFTELTPDSPYRRMKRGQQYVDAESAIEGKVESFLALYRSLHEAKKIRGEEQESTLSPDFIAAIEQCIDETYPPIDESEKGESLEMRLKHRLEECVNEEDIPPVIAVAAKDAGEVEVEVEVEVEQEQEVEEEQEIEQELELEVEVTPQPLGPKPYHTLVGSLSDFFVPASSTYERSSLTRVLPTAVHSVLRAHVGNIEYSSNLFIDNTRLGTSEHAMYHIDARYVLVVEDARTHAKRFVLVSEQDADEIKMKMLANRGLPEGTLTLMTLNGSVVDSTGNPAEKNDLEVKKALLIGRMCTGKVSFSKKEVEELETMLLPESPDRDQQRARLRNFYESVVKFLPSAAKAYRNSFLQKMLAKGAAKEEITIGGVADPSQIRALRPDEKFKVGELAAVYSRATGQYHYTKIKEVSDNNQLTYIDEQGREVKTHIGQFMKLQRAVKLVPSVRLGVPVPLGNRRALNTGESFMPGESVAVQRAPDGPYQYTVVREIRGGMIRFLDENGAESELAQTSFQKLKKQVSILDLQSVGMRDGFVSYGGGIFPIKWKPSMRVSELRQQIEQQLMGRGTLPPASLEQYDVVLKYSGSPLQNEGDMSRVDPSSCFLELELVQKRRAPSPLPNPFPSPRPRPSPLPSPVPGPLPQPLPGRSVQLDCRLITGGSCQVECRSTMTTHEVYEQVRDTLRREGLVDTNSREVRLVYAGSFIEESDARTLENTHVDLNNARINVVCRPRTVGAEVPPDQIKEYDPQANFAAGEWVAVRRRDGKWYYTQCLGSGGSPGSLSFQGFQSTDGPVMEKGKQDFRKLS